MNEKLIQHQAKGETWNLWNSKPVKHSKNAPETVIRLILNEAENKLVKKHRPEIEPQLQDSEKWLHH